MAAIAVRNLIRVVDCARGGDGRGDPISRGRRFSSGPEHVSPGVLEVSPASLLDYRER